MRVAVIFLVALVVRLAALDYFDASNRFQYDSSGYLTIDNEHGDDREYEGRAWHLVSGKNFWALPDGDGSGPPGYPFFIGMLYSVTGRNFWVPLVANAFLGGTLSIAVYYLARQSLSGNLALFAAAGVAIDPFLIFSSTRIMTESLAVFFLVLCLIMMIRTRQTDSLRSSVLCGLLCGAAILVRGNLIALPLAFAVWNLFSSPFARLRRQTVPVLLSAAALVFSVTMIGIANRPSQTDSQWERAGGWLTPNRYRHVALDQAARQKGGSLTREEMRVVGQNADAFIRTRPAWYVIARIWMHNFTVFWQLTPSIGSWVITAVYFGTSAGLILLGSAGAIRLLQDKKTRDQAVLWLLVIGTFTVLHTILISQPRYRVILEPLFWILAVSGGAALLQLKPAARLQTAPQV